MASRSSKFAFWGDESPKHGSHTSTPKLQQYPLARHWSCPDRYCFTTLPSVRRRSNLKGEHVPHAVLGEALPHKLLEVRSRTSKYPPAYPLTHRPTEGGAEHPNGPSQKDLGHWEPWMGSPRCSGQTRAFATGWQGQSHRRRDWPTQRWF
jgi:hypothetical protein